MKKKEEGTALILVLLVVAIVTVLGVTAVDRLHYEIKENLDSLKNQDIIITKNQSISFGWPLRKDTSLVYNNYFGI